VPDILIVCTANQCRSPLAEAVLQRRLRRQGTDALVHSAGLYESGRPATEDARAIAAGDGLDLSRHRSTEVSAELVGSADLVIAMARRHARELMALVPDAWGRTFPLKELVRRAEQAGGRRPGQPLGAWLDVLNAERSRQSLLGDDPDDDVADPVGLGMDAYRSTYREIDDLMARLVPLLAPLSPPA
jgi:low molecular weight protein-tyrosine phosphatase